MLAAGSGFLVARSKNLFTNSPPPATHYFGLWMVYSVQRSSSLLCGACGSGNLVPLVFPEEAVLELEIHQQRDLKHLHQGVGTLHSKNKRVLGGAFGWSPAWLQQS